MEIKLVLILGLVFAAGGCLDVFQGEEVPVVFAKVTLGEEPNGRIVVESVEAYGKDLPRLNAPLDDQFPNEFPAVYVDLVQNMTKINFQVGRDYTGPGVYDMSIGIEKGIDKNEPLAVVIQIVNEAGDFDDSQSMKMNWSTEIQNKTFK